MFLATLNLAQRTTPIHLQGRVSATITLALFGPQAPAQALGALAIAHAGYRQIFVASAALGLALATWLAGGLPRVERDRPGAGESPTSATSTGLQ